MERNGFAVPVGAEAVADALLLIVEMSPGGLTVEGLAGRGAMKRTDDYTAKLDFWIAENRVQAMPKAVGVPRFASRHFNSWDEFNAWKRDLLRQIADGGGLRWTR